MKTIKSTLNYQIKTIFYFTSIIFSFQSIIISLLREHTSERVPKFLTTSSSGNNLIVSSK